MLRSLTPAILASLTVIGCGVDAPTSNDPHNSGGKGDDPVPEFDCGGVAQFDLRVTADELDDYEGHAIMVSATEGLTVNDTPQLRYGAIVPGVVARGRFDVGCTNALDETSEYPAIAAYIDVNGDDICSAGDLGFVDLRYAWAGDTTLAIEPGTWVPVPSPDLVGPLQGSLDFCTGFFLDGE